MARYANPKVQARSTLNFSTVHAHLCSLKGFAVIEPSKLSIQTLERNGVSSAVIEAATRVTECLRLAGDDVAASTGDDLYDDATGRGPGTPPQKSWSVGVWPSSALKTSRARRSISE